MTVYMRQVKVRIAITAKSKVRAATTARKKVRIVITAGKGQIFIQETRGRAGRDIQIARDASNRQMN
jgi:hypothetical protein